MHSDGTVTELRCVSSCRETLRANFTYKNCLQNSVKEPASLVYILYLSESCPEMKDPSRTPTKNKEVLRGPFQSLSHTRFHCKEREHESLPTNSNPPSPSMYSSAQMKMYPLERKPPQKKQAANLQNRFSSTKTRVLGTITRTHTCS